jgi:hypothetical protein
MTNGSPRLRLACALPLIALLTGAGGCVDRVETGVL